VFLSPAAVSLYRPPYPGQIDAGYDLAQLVPKTVGSRWMLDAEEVSSNPLA
jgi:hypothetical protein